MPELHTSISSRSITTKTQQLKEPDFILTKRWIIYFFVYSHVCCFFFIQHNWIGASPDGLVTDPSEEDPNGLVEIKCPFRAKTTSTRDLCTQPNNNFCLKLVDGKYQLKNTHDYYYQIQGQLHVTCRNWCDFVVWSPSPETSSSSYTPVIVQRIHVDHDFWNTKVYPRLEEFYMKNMLPKIASPRHSSGQAVRLNVPFDYTPTTPHSISS